MSIVPASHFMGADGNDLREASVERFQADRDFLTHEEAKLVNKLPLEVYMHYADIERERERNDTTPVPDGVYTRLFRNLTMRKSRQPELAPRLVEDHTLEKLHSRSGDEKEKGATVTVVTESERFHAYRALRTASWQGVFFLITTDILGPQTAPYAISTVGYGGGFLAYFFLWVAAMGAGQILYRLYMKMDSAHYPVKNFSDLGERLFGRPFRHICNIIQSIQLLLNVALLILGNGVTLAQLIDFKLCFTVCNILWMIVGMIGGQIRSLKNIAWIANWNVWLNVVVIIMTIVGCSVYDAVPTLNFPTLTPPYPPVQTTGFAPAGNGWYTQVSGVAIAVFAYGGAMIFVEFMAEMRRPRDFYKAAFVAQTFIFVVYVIFGMVIYHYQGQYSYIIPTLSIANHGYLLAVNIIGLANYIIAAILYGNIGIKIFYYNILQAYFRAPDLNTRKGYVVWTITNLCYWSFAFVVGSAIPQLSSMTTLVGAVCILQFTYTFPPLMWCGYLVQKDAMIADQPWQPGMPYWSNRVDSWRDFSRWKRGFAPRWYLKTLLIVIFLASMSFCGLGAYSGVESIIETFRADGSATSFGCRAPGQPA